MLPSTRPRGLALALPLLIIAAVILAGCGSSTPTPTVKAGEAATAAATKTGASATAVTTGSTTPSAASTAQVKTGGTLVLGQPGDGTGKHYDVNLLGDKSVGRWWGDIYESLLGHEMDTFEIAPRLAEKWEFSSDAKTLTLFIRKGVKWHNVEPVNGREFTAEDVKWNLERIRDTKVSGVYWQTAMKQISSIDVIDKYTVKLNLASAYVPMLYNLAEPSLMMYPHELFDKYGDKQTTAAIGTGPFKFVSYEPEVSLKVVKNPDYWDKSLPRLDAIDRVIIKDSAARISALRSGQISYLDNLTRTEMETLVKTNPDLQVAKHLGNALELRINAASKTNKALADARVRKAIKLAIDRQALIQFVCQGDAIPIGLYTPTLAPAGSYRTPEELAKLPGYRTPKDADIAEAKKLLADAGYASGLSIEAYAMTGVPLVQQTMEVMQSQLKAVGIDLKIKLGDYATVGTAIQVSGEYEVAIFYATTGDADAILYSKYHTQSKANLAGWGNAALDKLLEAGRAESDLTKRTKIYRDIEDITQDQNWTVGLYAPEGYMLFRPGFKELRPMKGATMVYFQEMNKYVWLNK